MAPDVIANCRKSPARARWLHRLPGTLEDLRTRWSLIIEQPFLSDDVTCAWVAAVARDDGSPAVLKLSMPHMEAEHEIDGLQFWNGDPTVRLLAADKLAGAMLLERCEPGAALRTLPEPEQDVVIAGLLRRLWRVPPHPHPFRPLSELLDRWTAETLAGSHLWPDPALVRDGLSLFQELPRTARDPALLAVDLHAGNVLRARREPWLAIDPKPFFGDRAYDATQHLLNCGERILLDPLAAIRRIAALLDLDHQRVGLWTFARLAADPRQNWHDRRLPVARAIATRFRSV